jgi:hypothetical protein
MPHDKNGNSLEVGDHIIIEGIISQVFTGEEYCNINVETLEPMFPGTNKSLLTLNAKQVKRVVNGA